MKSEPLWTRNFLFAGAINFLLVLVFYMLVVIIAGYAVHELHASTTQAGIVAGLFILGMLVGRLFVNKIANHLGRKPTLWLSAFAFMLCSTLYFINIGIEFLSILRFFHGIAFGCVSSIIGTVIAQIIPISRRAEGVGYYSLSSTLGTALGPFLGIFMVLHASYSAIFLSALLVSILACIVCLGLQIPTTQQEKTIIQDSAKTSFIDQIIEPKALPISLIVFICSICYASILSFITFYAQQLNLEQAATIFFLVYAIAILVSRPFTGKLMDQKGENIVMYPALAILALSFFLLSFASNSFLLLCSAALLGLGFGNMQSIAQTIAIKSTSIERMGLATSTFFIALDAGIGFGPFFLGLLLTMITYSQMYVLAAFIVLMSTALYFFIHGRKATVVTS